VSSIDYGYVMTCFHPEPASLLDFSAEFDVDNRRVLVLEKRSSSQADTKCK